MKAFGRLLLLVHKLTEKHFYHRYVNLQTASTQSTFTQSFPTRVEEDDYIELFL